MTVTETVTQLADLGSRKTGTPSNLRAREVIRKAMDLLLGERCSTYQEVFEVPVYDDTQAQVLAGDKEIVARPVDYTGRIHPQASGRPLYLAGGEAWHYWGRDMKGRIAVCDFHILNHRILQIRRAAKKGAAGVVLVSGHPRYIQTGTGTPADSAGVDIPAVVIGQDDWNALRQSLTSEISIHMNNTQSDRQGMNLIYDLKGMDSERTIVLGAHYDSWFNGAQDNASGVAVLIGLAHELFRMRLRHNVRLIFFDAEELGMIGSRHHMKQRRHDYCFYLNVEMPLPVRKSRLRVMFTSGHPRAWSRLPFIQMWTAGYFLWPLPLHAFYFRKDMCFPSDVDPFYRNNIPCASTFCDGPDYHTEADIVDEVQKEKIPAIIQMLVNYVRAIDRS